MHSSLSFKMLISILGLGLLGGVAAINAGVPLGQAYEVDGATFADSEVYPWTYKLDGNAPPVYTRDDILALAGASGDKVRVERLNGQLVVVNSDLVQIGYLTGDVEADIESIYPNADEIAHARSVAQQQSAELQSGDPGAQAAALSQIEPGVTPRTPFGGLEKRTELCGGCFFIWQCTNPGEKGCSHTFCVIVFCIGQG